MRTTPLQIKHMVLDQLGLGEMRPLVLLVAVRKAIDVSSSFSGDLSATVSVALRQLVTSNAVVDDDGVYSLSHAK